MTLRIHPNDPIVWRSPESLQLGDGRFTTVLHNVDTPTERMIGALATGIHDDKLTNVAHACGLTASDTQQLLTTIARHLVHTSQNRRPALPDHTSRERSLTDEIRFQRHRQEATVCIDGMSDVGVLAAWMLAERGVGGFRCVGDEVIGRQSIVDRLLAGARLPGADRAEGLCDLLRTTFNVNASTETDGQIDFALITTAHALHPHRHQYWLRRDIRHLAVICGVHYALLSQTVEPGRGACLECLERSFSTMDETHPIVRSQLLDCRLPVWDSLRSHTLAAAVAERVLDAIDHPIRMPDNLVHQLDGLHWSAFTIGNSPECGCLDPDPAHAPGEEVITVPPVLAQLDAEPPFPAARQ